MAATTGQLGLVTPTQGTLAGTWGDTVNNGITEYTNIAIAGTLTLTNDGAVTLANTTGDAAASNITSSLTGAGTVTAQFAIVRVTGTLTTAKVVTAPSYSKTYTVVNAATGGIVTFKASGQTGVSIAVGETAFVYFNGTDYVKVVGTATAGAAGGSNTQVQFNSSGVLAGSSNMTFDGTTLTANALTVTNAVTLSGGTANGVAYLNGSKVVTSGSALTFDGSNVGVTASSSAGFVGITTQNTSAGAGASSGLGINNDSTASTYLRTYGSGQTNTLLGSVIANYTALLSDGAASNGILFGTLTNKPIIFGQNNAEQMRLTSTGLGIGTSSPESKLAVKGSSGDADLFSISDTTVPTTGGEYGVGMIKSNSTEYMLNITSYNANGKGLRVYHNGGTAANYAFYVSSFSGDRLILDGVGNLGLGVTPSAWGSGFKAFQIGDQGSLSYSANDLVLGTNAYRDSAGWKYLTSRYAPIYEINSGNGFHAWFTAPSGTAGNAITFTQAMTLDASGRLLLGVTSGTSGQVIIGSNGASQNALSFVDSNGAGRTFVTGPGVGTGTVGDFGFYDVTASQISSIYTGGSSGKWAWYTNGSERARIDSSGNMGIGTTSPSKKLDVVTSNNSGTETQLSLRNTSNGTNVSAGIAFGFNTVAADPDVLASIYGLVTDRNTRNGALTFSTAASATLTERARITSSGNLLVGTTSDQNRRLQVSGTLALLDSALNSIGDMSIDSSGVMAIAPYNGSGSTIVFQTAPSGSGTTERARITSTGNLLVGTTTNSSKLTLNGTQTYIEGTDTRVGTIRFASGGFNVTSVETELNLVTPYSSVVFLTGAAGTAAERARIDSSGNLLVGTSNSSGTIGAGFKVLGGRPIVVNADSANTTTVYEAYSTGASAYRFYVGMGGTVYATSTTITAISDQRLKENVQDLDDGLDVVMALKPRKFDWKEGKGANIKNARGFIAQEFETVLPDMIETWRDPAPEGEEPYKAINANLIPTLVKAIQEQQAIIESLKARLDAANL